MAGICSIGYVIWVAGTLMQLVIALRMFTRRLYREFPVFFAYTVFHVMLSAILALSLHYSESLYFAAYWISMTVDAPLSLAVIQEIFSALFKPYPGLQKLGHLLFQWAVLLLIAVSVIAAVTAPGSDANRLAAGLAVMHRSLATVEAGLFVFLFLFCRFFGLNWRDYAFGIATGFGLFAAVFLGASALKTYFGALADPVYALVQTAAYDCATMIWLGYLLAPRRAVQTARSVPEMDVARWNEALMELIRR
jgi:hypothetical protein